MTATRSGGRQADAQAAGAVGYTSETLDPIGRLLTPLEVAETLKVPVGTLAQWRYRRIGPPYMRIGRHVRYRAQELEAWIRRQAA